MLQTHLFHGTDKGNSCNSFKGEVDLWLPYRGCGIRGLEVPRRGQKQGVRHALAQSRDSKQ